MAQLRSKLKFPRTFPPLCLVCGIDSTPIKVFLIFVMGGLALASVCLLLWAVGTKRIESNEDNASLAIEAEKRKG
ncbi:MAG: hypothetical protein FJ116_06945 [Deltaproteobacteria bacterium]|nr:hypothetical protein [Deltaproteobacteria bacterium]